MVGKPRVATPSAIALVFDLLVASHYSARLASGALYLQGETGKSVSFACSRQAIPTLPPQR